MVLLYSLLMLIPEVLAQSCDLGGTSAFVVLEDFSFPSSLVFQENDTFYLSCPTSMSSPLLAPHGELFSCKSGTTITRIDTKEEIDFKDIDCQDIRETEVRKLNQTCEFNGTIMEIGLKLGSDFMPVISCCFDEEILTTYYCQYNITYHPDTEDKISKYGLETCRYNVTDIGHISFRCNFFDSNNIFKGTNLERVYDGIYQWDMFYYLGVNFTDYYDATPLATYPLIFPPGQTIQSYPSRDFVNIIPFRRNLLWYWVVIYANTLYDKTVDYSGTLGVATAINKEGEVVELFLGDDGKVPIPEWTWTIVSKDVMYFIYNGIGDGLNSIGEICAEFDNQAGVVFVCSLESVIHSEMRRLIDNTVCPTLGC